MTNIVGQLTAALADRCCLERELRQDGMATIYLAENVRHRRKVALADFRRRGAATPPGRSR